MFFALDVYHEETAKQYDKYVAFVRQKAPGVTELATPRPLPVREFQRRLQGHEAIVATLVTPLDLYVWAITTSSVTLTRHRDHASGDVASKVQRLRAGLLPGRASLPAFDAAVAHELYRLIFEPSAAALAGVSNVIWYGHGPLGVGPAGGARHGAAVEAAGSDSPRSSRRRSSSSIGMHSPALADLSLFAWHRDRPAANESGAALSRCRRADAVGRGDRR